VPKPGKGEAIIQVKAVGICGSDLHYFRKMRLGEKTINAPLIMGHEFSGIVVDLGSENSRLKIGDLVAVEPNIPCQACETCRRGLDNLCPNGRFSGSPPYDGALCEYLRHPTELLFPLPTANPEEAALIEPLSVAYHALALGGGLLPGRSVAVLGVGPIGLMALQLDKVAGATPIFAADRLKHRVGFAMRLGADHGIETTRESVLQRVMGETQDRGVDVVIEAAGSAEVSQLALDIAARNGAVILIGKPNDRSVSLDIVSAQRKEVRIFPAYRARHAYEPCIALWKKGAVDLKSMVTHRFPLTAVQDAFELVAAYGDHVIKAVIEPARA